MFSEDKTFAAIGQCLAFTASFLQQFWFTDVFAKKRVDGVPRAPLFATGSLCPTHPIYYSSRSSQGGRRKVQNLSVRPSFISDSDPLTWLAPHLFPSMPHTNKQHCKYHSQNDNFISDLATSGILPFHIFVAIITYMKLYLGFICCVLGRFLLKYHLLGAWYRSLESIVVSIKKVVTRWTDLTALSNFIEVIVYPSQFLCCYSVWVSQLKNIYVRMMKTSLVSRFCPKMPQRIFLELHCMPRNFQTHIGPMRAWCNARCQILGLKFWDAMWWQCITSSDAGIMLLNLNCQNLIRWHCITWCRKCITFDPVLQVLSHPPLPSNSEHLLSHYLSFWPCY